MVDLSERHKASHYRGAGPSFAEIVGQDELKEALLAVAANDDLDGLLVHGEKGTAKSTAVRALRDLLPAQEAVADCPFGCLPGDPGSQCADCRARDDPPTTERPVPLVTLPLGATRERVVGTLSVADAFDGEREFDPGLLARANRGILYVDEVNLLDDHLVDVILDAAASDVNCVERDGVSVSHPASFTLVGTMNPEEGDLRPQLRDRFALQTTVTACDDLDRRVAIIDCAVGRDEDRERDEDGEYRERLLRARDGLDDVDLPGEFARDIAELCREAGVDGHRGDIAVARAARTFAALDGRARVIESDVRLAAELALPHRLQSRPFEDAPDPEDVIGEHFTDETGDEGDESQREGQDDSAGPVDDEASEARQGGDERSHGDEPGDEVGDGAEASERPDIAPDAGLDGKPSDEEPDDGGASSDPEDGGANGVEARSGTPAGDGGGDGRPETERDGQESGETNNEIDGIPLLPGQAQTGIDDASAPDLSAPDAIADEGPPSGGSRSADSPGGDAVGPRVRTEPTDGNGDVDAAASVRAAATRGAAAPEPRDLRRSVRRGRASALVLFVVDASASMRPAMRAAKGTVLELLKDAYRQRDEVGFVTFAGDGAEVLLPPTDSVTHAARHLKDLPTGDRTPLPAGLWTASEVLDRADPATAVVVLVTDGRANVAAESPVRETREAATALGKSGAHVVVVDAGAADEPGVAGVVADETGGERVPLAALSAERIDATVGVAGQTEL